MIGLRLVSADACGRGTREESLTESAGEASGNAVHVKKKLTKERVVSYVQHDYFSAFNKFYQRVLALSWLKQFLISRQNKSH